MEMEGNESARVRERGSAWPHLQWLLQKRQLRFLPGPSTCPLWLLRRVPETSLAFSFTLTASEGEWHLALNGNGVTLASCTLESELGSPLEVLDLTMAMPRWWVFSTVPLQAIIFCSQGLNRCLVASCGLFKLEDKCSFVADRKRVALCRERLLFCGAQRGIESNLYR